MDASGREVARKESGHAEIATKGGAFLLGEASVLTFEPPAITIARATELISDDARGGLTDGGVSGFLSDDGSVEVDVVDLAIEIAEGAGDGGIGIDEEEAVDGVR